MKRRKNDICVIGIGKFGEAIVNELVKLKKQVLAIDKDENRLKNVKRIADAAVSDGGNIEELKDLGVDKFNTVIVASEDNIETIASLTELGVKNIIAKARSIRHERVLKQIGVNVILRPEAEAGIRTALIATNKNFIKSSEFLQDIGDGFVLGSTTVFDPKWINKPIKNLDFDKLGVNIVSIKRGAKVKLPSGNSELKSGDLVTLIGKIQNITKALFLLNDEASNKVTKLSEL